MSTGLRTDRPRIVHRLAVVLRFLDAFSGEAVRVPLDVSIPSLRWQPFHSSADATYRFLTTNADLPSGLFDVQVEAPGGEYVNHETITVQIPRPLVAHDPPALASDYLDQPTLWPTTRLRPPVGETVVLGQVQSMSEADVSGLRVVLGPSGSPLPAQPYTRTDANGGFLFRFPLLKAAFVGDHAVTTQSLAVELRDAANSVLAVNPSGPFVVPLGRATVLNLTIP